MFTEIKYGKCSIPYIDRIKIVGCSCMIPIKALGIIWNHGCFFPFQPRLRSMFVASLPIIQLIALFAHLKGENASKQKHYLPRLSQWWNEKFAVVQSLVKLNPQTNLFCLEENVLISFKAGYNQYNHLYPLIYPKVQNTTISLDFLCKSYKPFFQDLWLVSEIPQKYCAQAKEEAWSTHLQLTF